MRIRGLGWALLVGGVIMYLASWCIELILKMTAIYRQDLYTLYVFLLPRVLGGFAAGLIVAGDFGRKVFAALALSIPAPVIEMLWGTDLAPLGAYVLAFFPVLLGVAASHVAGRVWPGLMGEAGVYVPAVWENRLEALLVGFLAEFLGLMVLEALPFWLVPRLFNVAVYWVLPLLAGYLVVRRCGCGFYLSALMSCVAVVAALAAMVIPWPGGFDPWGFIQALLFEGGLAVAGAILGWRLSPSAGQGSQL